MSENMSEMLADRIRSEAFIADRPGQMQRLEAIADEVDRLRRGAKTLGGVVEQNGRAILDITGLHHFIGEDGDGDWGAVWENAYELLPRIQRAEASRAGALRDAAAEGWDAAVASMRYDDDTPVEIVSSTNPYRATPRDHTPTPAETEEPDHG